VIARAIKEIISSSSNSNHEIIILIFLPIEPGLSYLSILPRCVKWYVQGVTRMVNGM
jgi:hypothetical protein